ncbi:helix-turn-helix transcriptional regulator [Lysinibacillus sp. NPDC096418]|uniref:helix-turn-helix transcriptional regulator n=1 Tax=Lysinibacillus sp. NPDC096418 TaxID=3364138 RepID=UPI0038069592
MNKVAGYRVMLGLKQSEMASYMNISRQAYSQKEKGKIPFKDSEKVFLKDKFKVIRPNITIDEIFF